MMVRLNFVLAVVLVLSCFWLVRSSNEARSLFTQLERAQDQERQLQVEFERLKVDRRTAATPLVVEGMVRNRLHMFNANPSVTHYVNGASLPAALAASAAVVGQLAAGAGPASDAPASGGRP
jgi:cell division protein FtsL